MRSRMIYRFRAAALSVAALAVMMAYHASTASAALTGEWLYEGGSPLADTSGNGNALGNTGGVTFGAPIGPAVVDLGSVSANFVRSGSQWLAIPGAAFTGGTDSFTYATFARKNADETGGHQTFLSSNRFRFQWRNTGTTADGLGTLRLDVNGAGAGGGNESGDGTLPINTWLFTALTYDAGSQALVAYMRPDTAVQLGQPVIVRTASGAGLNDITSVVIGRDISGIGGADGWGGQFDNSRFWDSQALSAQQLRDVFNTSVGLAAGPLGKVASYNHEGADPLADGTGHGLTLSNTGVAFVAPPAPTAFQVGNVVAEFDRGGDALNTPVTHTPGDSFTFAALVRKNNDETGGFQTILSSNRFRFQFSNTGTTGDGVGRFRIDTNGSVTGSPEAAADSFPVEEWFWVALRYDNITKDIEIFAADDSPNPMLTPIITRNGDLSNMARFRIGADGLSGIGGFDAFGGWIDSAMFWDEALSDAQLFDAFRQARPIPEPATATLALLALGGLLRRRRRTA